jgi:signal transduction histidine kinase
MRERAERIGGSFALESSPGQGSAMTLKVPEKLAYAGAARRKSLFSSFRLSKRPSHA